MFTKRMNHYVLFSLLLGCGFVLITGTQVSAAVIYESGTLGETGVPFSELGGSVPGTNIKDVVFTGVRFELNQPVITSEVGGHFVAPVSGTFFAAIIALNNGNDFPQSGDLSTPDVLGKTLLTFPTSSAEVFGDLTLSLEPGRYALVFGSGLFDATTNGGAVRNGTDIGDPTYIGHQPGAGWFNLAALPSKFENHRFIIKGTVVPEPSTLGLIILALVFIWRVVNRSFGILY